MRDTHAGSHWVASAWGPAPRTPGHDGPEQLPVLHSKRSKQRPQSRIREADGNTDEGTARSPHPGPPQGPPHMTPTRPRAPHTGDAHLEASQGAGDEGTKAGAGGRGACLKPRGCPGVGWGVSPSSRSTPWRAQMARALGGVTGESGGTSGSVTALLAPALTSGQGRVTRTESGKRGSHRGQGPPELVPSGHSGVPWASPASRASLRKKGAHTRSDTVPELSDSTAPQ